MGVELSAVGTTLSDRAVDEPGLLGWLNRELRPIVRALRVFCNWRSTVEDPIGSVTAATTLDFERSAFCSITMGAAVTLTLQCPHVGDHYLVRVVAGATFAPTFARYGSGTVKVSGGAIAWTAEDMVRVYDNGVNCYIWREFET